jgi:predicted AlkP superfamily phosphohydrolase/phosphomutase
VHVFENDTGPDDANHAHEGLYVLVADGVPAGRGPQRALHDVAPTLLELLGEPVPAEMEGQSMLRPAAAGEPESSASRDDSVTDTPTLSR